MAADPWAPLVAAACLLLAAAAFLLVALAPGPLGRQRDRLEGLAPWLAAAGVAILAGALAARGLRVGHWPLTSTYEFALAFALASTLAVLLLGAGRRDRAPATAGTALLLAAGLLAYARLGLPAFQRAIQPLTPALDSVWLPLHVGTAALAYGALSGAGAAGLVWLVWAPERPSTERWGARAIAAGYPLLTLSLIFGMIWAEGAWGRYWGWDLKEVWTLATWLVYTLYWHLRHRPRWPGRRVAWLALAGLVAIWITFLGTGPLARAVGLESLHLF